MTYTIQELEAEREQARRAWSVAYHEMMDAETEHGCLKYIATITRTIKELSR